MDSFLCAVTVVLAVITIAVVAGDRSPLWRAARRSGFYTESAVEAPTRSYTPYTGTEPLGVWGSTPWGDTAYSMAPTLCR